MHTFASIWFWYRDRSLLFLLFVALFCGLSPATCTTSFCYLFFAGSFLFFILSTKKRKTFLSLDICSLVKAGRQIGRKRNENMNVTRVTKQPNIKCDEFNTLSSIVSDESNSSCRVVCGVLKAPEISIFQSALLYSFAHTSRAANGLL